MTRLISALASLGFWLVLLGAAGVVLSPIGYRLGAWDFAFALRTLLRYATIACIAGFVLCVLTWLAGRGLKLEPRRGMAAVLLLGALLSGYVLFNFNKVRSFPMIHDIATDTAKPPAFVALEPARKAAPNGFEYKGAEIAEQQKKAYPDLAPLRSNLPPPELFAKAESAARAAGWEIAAAQPNDGRIEATVTSLLYGFKDDVVIRVQATDGGSVLDMRSMSRVGRSDLGVNAARIRAFLARLRE